MPPEKDIEVLQLLRELLVSSRQHADVVLYHNRVFIGKRYGPLPENKAEIDELPLDELLPESTRAEQKEFVRELLIASLSERYPDREVDKENGNTLFMFRELVFKHERLTIKTVFMDDDPKDSRLIICSVKRKN